MSREDLGAFGSVDINDLWGWTDPETGKEYALVGREDGTAFVDVSDPLNPVYLGDLPTVDGTRIRIWRDIKTYDHYALIVADNVGEHGLQIFDLEKLRTVTAPPARFRPDALYTGFREAHNIVVNEESGFAYAVGTETCGGGLHIIDINDPLNPTKVGCFNHSGTGRRGTGYTHDAECVNYVGPDTKYRGHELCFGANETAISIADLSDKSSPVAIVSATYPDASYVHQGWLTPDQLYFIQDDELDESGQHFNTRTIIWDVSDIENPEILTQYFGQ